MVENKENSAGKICVDVLKSESDKDYSDQSVSIDFGPDGQKLIPVAVQEWATNEMLLIAFMNQQAFELTYSSGKAHFWSRSRNQLWLKGETSGDFLMVRELYINCEENSLLLKVELAGKAACHTGNKSCYYRRIL